MQVPGDKEPFSWDSEPETREVSKSPQKREKPPSPVVDTSTPKQEPREEKVARRERPSQPTQLRRKPSDLIQKAEPVAVERKK